MTAVCRPEPARAEILHRRGPHGRRVWFIDVIASDGSRTVAAETDSMRAILDAALVLERQGLHVSRRGLVCAPGA